MNTGREAIFPSFFKRPSGSAESTAKLTGWTRDEKSFNCCFHFWTVSSNLCIHRFFPFAETLHVASPDHNSSANIGNNWASISRVMSRLVLVFHRFSRRYNNRISAPSHITEQLINFQFSFHYFNCKDKSTRALVPVLRVWSLCFFQVTQVCSV